MLVSVAQPIAYRGRVELSLRKWYLDVVGDDGRVGIAYRAEVRSGRLHHDVAGLTVYPGDGPPAPWRFSMRSTSMPEQLGGCLHWEAERLSLVIDCEALEPSFDRRLLETPDGAIDWHCAVPRARVRLASREATIEGMGYAERLDLTGIAPWSIPADEIRWGRFLSDTSSLVWIDWRGERPQRLVFRNGCPVVAIELTDDVIVLADGTRLTLSESRTVGDETLGHLFAPLEALDALVRPFARVQQTRWRSRGELRFPGVEVVRGWALHELLRR